MFGFVRPDPAGELGEAEFVPVHAAVLIHDDGPAWLDVDGFHQGLEADRGRFISTFPEGRLVMRRASGDDVRFAFAVNEGVLPEQEEEARGRIAGCPDLLDACARANERLSRPGSRSLRSIAGTARYLLSDGIHDEEVDRLEIAPDEEVVRIFYTQSDCDDFAIALHRMTGWPIMALSSAERGLLHRFVVAPDGRLLDALGWTNRKSMTKRYGAREPIWAGPGDERIAHSANIGMDIVEGIDEHLASAVSAIRRLSGAPFEEEWFRAMSRKPLEGVDYLLPGYEDDGAETPVAP